MSVSTRWAERYLGVPHKVSGTGMNGADCWGLYALILSEQAGISYPEIEASDRRNLNAVRHTIAAQIARGAWIEKWTPAAGPLDRTFPAAFDCLVMTAETGSLDQSMRRAPLHVACALGDGRLLQTTRRHGVHVMAIDDPRLAGRLLGVYRPATLALGDPSSQASPHEGRAA